MRYKDLNRVLDGLKAMGDIAGLNFALAMAHNELLIENELERIKRATRTSPDMEECQKEVQALYVSLCDKDQAGRPVVKDGQIFVSHDKTEELNAGVRSLEDKHAEAILAHKRIQQEYHELLDHEVKLAFQKVKACDLPASLTKKQADTIIHFLES